MTAKKCDICESTNQVVGVHYPDGTDAYYCYTHYRQVKRGKAEPTEVDSDDHTSCIRVGGRPDC